MLSREEWDGMVRKLKFIELELNQAQKSCGETIHVVSGLFRSLLTSNNLLLEMTSQRLGSAASTCIEVLFVGLFNS